MEIDQENAVFHNQPGPLFHSHWPSLSQQQESVVAG